MQFQVIYNTEHGMTVNVGPDEVALQAGSYVRQLARTIIYRRDHEGTPIQPISQQVNADGSITVMSAGYADMTFMPVVEGLTESEREQLDAEAHKNRGWNEKEIE